MVRRRIKLKPSFLGEEKEKKKITLPKDWWVEDISIELDDFETHYFINKEMRRVR